MSEDHDRSRVVGSHLRERLLRPRDDQLVGARDPLPRRKLGAPVCDDRPPAEQVRRRRKRLGRVDRAVDQQAGRWAVHLGEDLAALQFEHAIARAADQLVGVGSELGRPVADRLAPLDDEQLRPEPFALDHCQDDAAASVALEREQALDHGRRSTNTSISPPHGRPTAQACSSEMPYESSFGAPDSKTSCASWNTSPSTQPPETEPHSFPLPEIARLEPTGRG